MVDFIKKDRLKKYIGVRVSEQTVRIIKEISREKEISESDVLRALIDDGINRYLRGE